MRTSSDPGSQRTNLIDGAKAIILTPKDEWPRIAASTESIGDIYRRWVLPLAAIGPVAQFIGGTVFGYGAFGFSFRPSIIGALSSSIMAYVLTLIGVYVLALVIDGLAPTFGGTRNKTAAFKVAAFGATAAWVAGIFGVLPALGFLGLLGLYSFYLIFLGLPLLMKSPAEKATGYIVVVVVAMVILSVTAGTLATMASGRIFGAGGMPTVASGTLSGTITTPGGGSVDMGKLEQAGKAIGDTAVSVQRGEAKAAIAPDVLQRLLPAALGNLARTSIESSSMGAGGISGAQAEARYGEGESAITLTVTDMGAIGGIAALGSAFNVQSSKQDATSYEKVGTVDGRMTTERFDSASKRGEYSTIVAGRVMVQAEGNAASIDVLKGAVAAVDLNKVASLAK